MSLALETIDGESTNKLLSTQTTGGGYNCILKSHMSACIIGNVFYNYLLTFDDMLNNSENPLHSKVTPIMDKNNNNNTGTREVVIVALDCMSVPS